MLLPRESVLRQGPSLLISVAPGKTVVLRDTLPDNDEAMGFTYAGYLSWLRAHVVHETGYEGTAWLLVFVPSGRRLQLTEPPIPSPDSALFLVISSDLEAQLQPTSIEVYRVKGDTAVREVLIRPSDTTGALQTGNWGPSAASWITNDSVSIRTEVLTWPDVATKPGNTIALVHSGGAWSLVGSVR